MSASSAAVAGPFAPPFAPPRESPPVELEAHVAALHPHAWVKGIFFLDAMALARASAPHVDIEARAGIPRRRYMPFLNYSCADWLRVKVACAETLFPDLPQGAAVRAFGRTALQAFLQSRAGRLMFDLVSPTLADALSRAPSAYRIISNAGSIRFVRQGPTVGDIVFEGFPGCLESYQVGIVEGVCEHYRQPVSITCSFPTLVDGTIRVSW
jgi:uncharacterized protein (TIGR02265 family)